MQFKLGQVVATPGAIRAMEENGIEAWSLLSRHANGDWGCIPEEDKLENQLSVENGYRRSTSGCARNRSSTRQPQTISLQSTCN